MTKSNPTCTIIKPEIIIPHRPSKTKINGMATKTTLFCSQNCLKVVKNLSCEMKL